MSDVKEKVESDKPNVILYSTGCPKCKVLKNKLDKKGITYSTITDVGIMQNKGFSTVPKLEVDEKIMDFKEAFEWIGE